MALYPLRSNLRRLSACLLLLWMPLAAAQPQAGADQAPEADTGLQTLQTATSRRFMAATANPHATDAAYAMLKRGGSAVDAAIATQLVLGLTEPQSSGIGGGAFMLHWDARRKHLSSWDGRETAPQSVDETHFLREDGEPFSFFDAVVGGHAVGVPGVLAMLELAHQQHGKLPWAALFQPAIELAEKGFAISPRLHLLLERMPRLAVNPEITAYFFQADGKTPKPVGTVLRNPDYAHSLRLIAEQGTRVFYEGELARAIVDAVANDPVRPGGLSLDDMKQYRAIQRDPLCGDFHVYRICGMPPPSSGGTTVLSILGTLAHIAERPPTDETQRLHLFAEASRLAFADRDHYIADPDQVEVPTDALIDPPYLAERAALISPERALVQVTPGTLPQPLARITGINTPQPSTSHFSIVDARGNIVSLTSSIEMGFGSRILVGGFLLNNQLTDFAFVPEGEDGSLVANRPAAGKRPLSSMSPTIVFQSGKPVLAIGSPGGTRIIDYVARTLWDMLGGDIPMSEAIARGHVVHMGRKLELEAGRFPPPVKAGLEALGHEIDERFQNSGLQGIRIHKRKLEGAADPRREGTVKGQ